MPVKAGSVRRRIGEGFAGGVGALLTTAEKCLAGSLSEPPSGMMADAGCLVMCDDGSDSVFRAVF